MTVELGLQSPTFDPSWVTVQPEISKETFQQHHPASPNRRMLKRSRGAGYGGVPPAIPEVKGLRQEDHHELETDLSYIVSLCPKTKQEKKEKVPTLPSPDLDWGG